MAIRCEIEDYAIDAGGSDADFESAVFYYCAAEHHCYVAVEVKVQGAVQVVVVGRFLG